MRTKVKLLLACLCLVGMMSCNDNEVDVESQKVDITYTAMVSEGNSSSLMKSGVKEGVYARGNAPVYVKGLDVKVENLTYSKIETTSFEFKDEMNSPGQPMNAVITAGKNSFFATTTCMHSAFTEKFQNTIPIQSGTDLLSTAAVYGDFLTGTHPIFAILEDSQENIDIPLDDNPKIAFDLEHRFGRLNIIFESEADLDFHIQIYKGDFSASIEHSGIDHASGVILNDTQVLDNNEVQVYIGVKLKNATNYKNITGDGINITCSKGVNKTYLIRYNGSAEVTADYDVNSYQTFEPQNGGEELN